jgi:hypothetical protein
MRTRAVAAALVLCVLFGATGVALDSKKVLFVGGTIPTKLKEGTEGTLNTADETKLILVPDAAGKDQGIVIEVGKDLVRTLSVILKARTGKDITFQDDEARKNVGK